MDFVVSIIQRYTGGGNGSIGYSAHIAGGVAGILIGMNVLRNFHHKVIFLRCKKSKISTSFGNHRIDAATRLYIKTAQDLASL